MKNTVAIVGNLTKDTIFWVDKLPEIDDVATVRRHKQCFGGRGAIVAMILSALGVEADIITTVPEISNELQIAFAERNCTTTSLELDKDANLFNQVYVTIGRSEENCTSLYLPGNCKYKLSSNQKTILSSANIVYFTSHDIAYSTSAFEFVNPERSKIIANISSYMLMNEAYLSLLLEKAEIIIGNELEFEFLQTKINLTCNSEVFSQFTKLKSLIVTQGAKGVYFLSNDGLELQMPAKKVTPLTPLGVGDAFSSGVIYGLVKGFEPQRLLTSGLALAAISIESEESCPTLKELSHFII